MTENPLKISALLEKTFKFILLKCTKIGVSDDIVQGHIQIQFRIGESLWVSKKCI